MLRIEVPPDVDVEDRVIGPLTFRHLGYLAVAGGGAAAGLLHRNVATIAVGALFVVVGLLGAGWRPQGRPLDAWLAPARAYRQRRRDPGRPDVEPPALPAPEPTSAAAPMSRPARRRPRLPRPRIPTVPAMARPGIPVPRRPIAVAAAATLVIVAAGGVAVLRGDHQQPMAPLPHRPSVATPAVTHAPPVTVWIPAPWTPVELTDGEVDDAVDAIFEWLTGP